MDLNLYFNPVNPDLFSKGSGIGRHTLGYTIGKETGKTADFSGRDVKVALVGVPDETGTSNKGCSGAPAAIREQLYRLASLENLRQIIDLGDLKPGRSPRDLFFALRDVTEYLTDEGITMVLIGGGQDLSAGISRAFKANRDFVLSVVDARVDVKTGRQVSDASNFLSRIIRENPDLYHIQMIALQSHLIPPAVAEYLRRLTFETLHLGILRDDFSALEPMLRHTSFLSFDISAVRQADAPGHIHPSPNGLFGEEACQVARYAGLSPRLSVFGLFEVNPLADASGTTAGLAAQMIWYFLEAFTHRRSEDPLTDKAPLTKYFVEMELHGEPVVFYHHPPTNRWWIEIFGEEGDSRIVPCRESDYKTAVQQEIPDVWWKYARKSDRLSK